MHSDALRDVKQRFTPVIEPPKNEPVVVSAAGPQNASVSLSSSRRGYDSLEFGSNRFKTRRLEAPHRPGGDVRQVKEEALVG